MKVAAPATWHGSPLSTTTRHALIRVLFRPATRLAARQMLAAALRAEVDDPPTSFARHYFLRGR